MYDFLVLGSGLGGLVSAIILAKEGNSVCVLEKNNQFGGNLQTFSRDKIIFDTGIHYIGGLSENEPLHQYFQYIGIMNDLMPLIEKMDENAFDFIRFNDDETYYPHAQGYANFVKQLTKYFPEDEEALKIYCEKIQEVCDSFPLYNLKKGEGYQVNNELMSLNTSVYMDSLFTIEKLKAVLLGNNILYAGEKNKTPFYVHALSINSYIESAWRCKKGGSQITKLLLKRLKELGGKYFNHQEVTKIEVENNIVKAIHTKKGDVFLGNTILSNIDAKTTISLAGKENFKKAYINRIKNLEDTVSCFSIYLVLKPNTVKYISSNIYHHINDNDLMNPKDYTETNWPKNYMISYHPSIKNTGFTDNISLLAFMRFDELEKWKKTSNTVYEKGERGADYEAFKEERTQQIFKHLAQYYPEIHNNIQNYYTSSPLSYRDYIGLYNGGIYGYVKDSNNPLQTFIPAKTKIDNLYLTGQTVNMHGVMGVTIGAVITCAHILGFDYLIQKIHKELKEKKH